MIPQNGASERLSLHLPWELPRYPLADLALANMLAGPLISVATEIADRVATNPRGAALEPRLRAIVDLALQVAAASSTLQVKVHWIGNIMHCCLPRLLRGSMW